MENKNQNNLIGENRLRSILKDEMKNFATKDDAKSIRDEMKNFATKDDLKNFATRDDLAMAFVKADIRMNKIYDKLDSKIDNKFNDVLNQNDAQIKLLVGIQQELAAHNKSYKDHGKILDNHEKRIKVLELEPAM